MPKNRPKKNSLYGTVISSDGSSAVALKHAFLAKEALRNPANLIVNGFSPQVWSDRKNAVGALEEVIFAAEHLEQG